MSGQSPPEGLPVPRRYWAILGVWLALTAAVLDGAFISLILPAIARDLHATAAQAIWVVNGFQLAVVMSLLPLSALGERFSYRTVFLCGVAVFTSASVVCFLADTVFELACARALQGLGAAGLMSTNGAMLRYIYPLHLVGRGFGLNAMIIAVFGAVGPGVAALVLAHGDWRWLFAVNVVVGLLAMIVGLASFPSSPRAQGKCDKLSVALNVAAFGLIVAAAERMMDGHVAAVELWMLATGLLAGAGLIARSLSQRSPLFPLDLLRMPITALAAATSAGAFAAQMLAFVLLPFYFESELGASPLEIGGHFMAWCIAIAVIAPLAGRLSDLYPVAVLAGVGLVCFSIGVALLALLPSNPHGHDITWRMVLCGIGFGLFQAPNNRALISSAPPGRIGAAAGVQAMARVSGQIIGALGAAFFLAAATPHWRAALGTGSVFAALAMIASLWRLPRAQTRM